MSQAFNNKLTVPHSHWAEAAQRRNNSLFGLDDEGFKSRMTAVKPI